MENPEIARTFEYIAITDHTQAVRVAGGARGVRRQAREIDRLQRRCPSPVILKGAEVDILEDGSLDLDERTLGELDPVVAAVHSKFSLPRVHVLAHPTGRLIGRRDPYAVDMSEIVQAARDYGVLLEINAQPAQPESARPERRARRDGPRSRGPPRHQYGCPSGRRAALDGYGVDQSGRGWCRADDIANTRDLAGLRALLAKG